MIKQIKFYTKDQDGNRIFLESNKIYAEFSTGETFTIENSSKYKVNNLLLRSYYGNNEIYNPKQSE